MPLVSDQMVSHLGHSKHEGKGAEKTQHPLQGRRKMPVQDRESQTPPEDSEKEHDQASEECLPYQDAHQKSQSYLRGEKTQLVYVSLEIIPNKITLEIKYIKLALCYQSMYKIQKGDLKFPLQTGITGQIPVYRLSLQREQAQKKRVMQNNNLFENQHLILSDGKKDNSPTHQRQSIEEKESEDHHEASPNYKLGRFYNKHQ